MPKTPFKTALKNQKGPLKTQALLPFVSHPVSHLPPIARLSSHLHVGPVSVLMLQKMSKGPKQGGNWITALNYSFICSDACPDL